MHQQPTYLSYTKVTANSTWAIFCVVISLHLLAAWWLSFTPIKILKAPNNTNNIHIQFVQANALVAVEAQTAKETPIKKTLQAKPTSPKSTVKKPIEKPAAPKPKALTKPTKPKPAKPKPTPKKLITSSEKSAVKQREIAIQQALEKQQAALEAQHLEEQRLEEQRLADEAKRAKEAEQARLAQERADAEAAAEAQLAAQAQQAADAAAKQAALNHAIDAAKGQTINASYKHKAKPSYPRKEEIRGRTGKVSFKFVIGKNGKAKNIEVTEATSNGFKMAALKALKASTFNVTSIQGVVIEQKARTTTEFTLE